MKLVTSEILDIRHTRATSSNSYEMKSIFVPMLYRTSVSSSYFMALEVKKAARREMGVK